MIPMSAGKAVIAEIRYPVIASPKLDGVRCVIDHGIAYSRKWKPLPNRFLQAWVARQNSSIIDGYDGELIVGPPTAADCFRQTMSGIMSSDYEPDFTFYVFDNARRPEIPYEIRRPFTLFTPRMEMLNHQTIYDADELMEYENQCVDAGYEGIMIRDPNGLYKHGRSTTRGRELLKIKRFEDAEAVVVGFVEEYANNNPQTTNEIGRSKRSSHKINMAGKGSLGALVVRGRSNGVTFNIGSGFTAEQRAEYWDKQNELMGKTVTYRFFPVGVKDAPRHPIFHGFRED